jgi:hypothetical protein
LEELRKYKLQDSNSKYIEQLKFLHEKPHYIILENFLDVEDNETRGFLDYLNNLKSVKKKVKKFIVVQNPDTLDSQGKKFSGENDDNRFLFLPSNVEIKKYFNKTSANWIEPITLKLKDILSLFKNLVNPFLSILLSLAGCKKQATHADYQAVNTEPNYEYSCQSYIALVALMDETFIYLANGDKKNIPKGHVFLARGDVIHAGSDYEEANVRLHYYFDNINWPKKLLGKKRKTFFCDAEQAEIDASNEPPGTTHKLSRAHALRTEKKSRNNLVIEEEKLLQYYQAKKNQ